MSLIESFPDYDFHAFSNMEEFRYVITHVIPNATAAYNSYFENGTPNDPSDDRLSTDDRPTISSSERFAKW